MQRCELCRSVGHTRVRCMDPRVMQKQTTMLCEIETYYVMFEGDPDGFRDTMKMYFMGLTVLDIKIVIQHYKSVIYNNELTQNIPTRKEPMIEVLIEMILHQIRFHRLIFRGPTVTTITGRVVLRPREQTTNRRVITDDEDFIPFTCNLPPPPTIPIPMVKTDKKWVETECPVCYGEINDENFVHLECKHEFCKECIVTMWNTNCQKKCPMCRAKFDRVFVKNV